MLTSPPKRRGSSGPLDPTDQAFSTPTATNLAELALIQVGTFGTTGALPEGWEVYVETTRCKWRLRTTAVAVVAMEIVNSSVPTRQWWRQDCAASDSNPWITQLNWQVSAGGSDEALGTAAAPLVTFNEFERRMRGAVLNGIYTVDVRNNQGRLRSIFNLGPNGMVVIDGNDGATPAAAWPAGAQLAAAGAYTAPNPAGPEWAIITANPATLADWTPFVGRRVRVSANAFPHAAGPLDRCSFWVIQVNPAGGGNNTARITVPNGFDPYDPLLPGLTGGIPNNADFILAEDLITTGEVDLEVIKQAGVTVPALNIVGFNFTNAAAPVALNLRARVPTAPVNPLIGRPIIFGCRMNVTQCFEPINIWESLFVRPGANLQMSGKSYRELLSLIDDAFMGTGGAFGVESANCEYSGCLWQSAHLLPRPGFHNWPIYCGFFDEAGGDMVRIDMPGVNFRSDGALFGVNFNRGLYVLSPGFEWVYTIAPALNAGGVSEFRVLGAEYTWGANLPYPAAATVEDVAIRALTV